MNKQQAINLLKNLEQSLDDYCELNDEGKTAFRMAITALNCSEFPNNSDTISRQAAIDALYSVDEYNARSVKAIKELPSAQPDIARDIATIIENEKDMRVIAKNAQSDIILCKDCKYWKQESICDGYCSEIEKGGFDEDHFCSYAERRTDE